MKLEKMEVRMDLWVVKGWIKGSIQITLEASVIKSCGSRQCSSTPRLSSSLTLSYYFRKNH